MGLELELGDEQDLRSGEKEDRKGMGERNNQG